MKSPWYRRWDWLMRMSHLYTGLFLLPWMMVYAISAFCLNHNTLFTTKLGMQPKWEVIRDEDYTPTETLPSVPVERARAVLQDLELDGGFRIVQDDATQLVIFRVSAKGYYRVTWKHEPSHVVIEQQRPVTFYSVVNALHFYRGYGEPGCRYLPGVVWAVVVDAVTLSTVLWVISGVYLWVRRPKQRVTGGLCLGGGIVLFVLLVVLLCR